jgi:hypothetical protein
MAIKLSKSEITALLTLFLVAFLLRIFPLLQNNLSFHFDMSRDAFVAEQIWKNFDVKIQGPATSTAGLFHGVLYYYLIAPFYAISQGNPWFVSLVLAAINSTTVIPLYLLGKSFFKSVQWGLLVTVLFVSSFEAIQYGPWLSNPQPAVVTSAWFFYFLFQWIQGRKSAFVMVCLLAALSMQFQFFLLYLFFVILITPFLFKLSVKPLQLILGVMGIGIVLSTMIASVFAFGGPLQTINSLSAFSDTKGSLDANFTDLLLLYINNLSKVFTNNLFPLNVFIGGILFLVTTIWLVIKKELFILLGIFSSLIMFFFGGHSNVYANIALVPPTLLGFVYLIKSISIKYKPVVLVILVGVMISNFYMTFKAVPKGQYLLVIQPDMILRNQLALVDQTYLLSDGKPFAINSLTVPLWTNTTWAYLYHYYGFKKYGYVPTFYGNDPVGSLGADEVKKSAGKDEIKFYIVEPLKGIPGNITDSEFEKEKGNTTLIKEYNYGQIRLQQRQNNTKEASGSAQSGKESN